MNDPSVIKDPSWIKPTKYVGVWWEMHVGKASWDYSGGQVGSQQATKVPHGANTANVKDILILLQRTAGWCFGGRLEYGLGRLVWTVQRECV